MRLEMGKAPKRAVARLAGAMVAAAVFAGAIAIGAPPPSVAAFLPMGAVAGPEQISVRFATPMVALGDPRLPAPITGNCSAGGSGRWADASTYAIDFATPLPGGRRCTYELVAGLKDARGAAITGPRRFTFTTGGPTLRQVAPQYETIAEDQAFLLAVNALVTPASVAAHASCLIDGVGEAVPLDLLPQRQRDIILTGAGKDWQVKQLLVAAGWQKDPYSEEPVPARAAIYAAKCRRSLPPGGQVTLVWGAGVATADGLVAGEADRRNYKVRPAFSARLECSRVNAAARCSPLEPLRISFSGQVPMQSALAVRIETGDGKSIAPDKPKRRAATLDTLTFTGPFPERAALRIVMPAGLTDDAGRPLANAARFPLETATGDYPPLAKFAGSFGILEAAEGGVLPVTLRGVESPARASATVLPARALAVANDAEIAAWLRTLDAAEDGKYIEEPIAGSKETRTVNQTRATPLIGAQAPARRFTIARDRDPRQFEVVGIPLKTRGFHVVELASPALGAALLGPGRTRYVATGALVTDMAVHFQWGLGRSLAWVTRLSDATPVANALVAVSDSCTGKRLWQGRTDKAGRAAVGDVLPPPTAWGGCDYGEHPLIVSARTADDMSFTLSRWGNGIQPGDFNLSQGYGYERAALHTVFDRTLAKPGETLHMKLLLRSRGDAGIGPGPTLAKPQLIARHGASDTKFEAVLKMAGQSGTASLALPKSAPLGDYSLELIGEGRDPLFAGNFSVEEFRLPAIRASVSGPRTPQVAPKAVPVDLALTYLSGGAVGNAPVKLRTSVTPREVSLPDYEGWTFGGEPVVAGIVALDGDGEAAGETASSPTRARLEPVTLSATGAARVSVGDLGAITRPSSLVAEMDYDDANGEVATKVTRIDLEPAALRVGLKPDGWLAKADDLRLKLVVLDLAGRPLKGAAVKVSLFSRETYSYRKRLIGGFYAYDNSRETKRLAASCDVRSDDKGLAGCQLDAGVSGEVIAVAEAADAQGRVSRATTSVWLAGDDDWWFGGDNGDRMDVVPESPSVAADGIARLQVRMPFRQATALVTVLRDGVIDSFVTEISGRDPVIEVRMKQGYAPNVYVSVLAVRGRVAGWRLWLADLARRWNLPWISRDAASPTALVDLAKPSYRLGLVKLKVGWEAQRLAVKVAPDRPGYPVRATAQALVSVAAPAGRKLPADAEIAFVAVDEALLQLKGNDSWDVLAAMMAERPLAVVPATAQTQVVGKRHYGRKAVASGGGGGDLSGLTRRDFDPLLGWWGRVPLGPDGRVRVPVKLNDSLSGFRLVAVATAGNDLFGTGEVRIRTTQDLQLLAGIPPVVRDGDDYVASLVVRNTTSAAMPVRLTGRAGAIPLPPLAVTVPAGGARTAAWRVVAPLQGPVVWQVTARAAHALDRVEVTQAVIPAVPVTAWAASFFQAGAAPFPVAAPAGALPGRGGVEVALSRSLGGGLPGVRAAMAAYPYDCIEQRFAIAVSLGDRARWDAAASALAGYLDGDGLVRFFPADWIAGDDALTAHLLRLSALSGWPLPAATRARMIDGLTRFVAGRLERSHAAVLVIDKAIGSGAVADLSGDGPPRRMAALAALASVGAATPALAETISVVPDAWSTSSIIDWAMVLDAVPGVAQREARLAQAEAILRSRLDVQGSTLRITRSAALWQTLASPDTTRATLLLLALRRPGWQAETPRLARALLLSQQRGAWDTTPANALGTLAMAAFARAYEAAPVAGTTRLTLGTTARDIAWRGGDPAPVMLPWPAGTAPLAVAHTGSGAPWVMVTTRAAVPLAKAFASGFTLQRRVTPVQQAVAGRWSRGDVLRVTLTVAARAPVEWVVINDPVPAGATILGGSLGGRSQLLAGGEATTEPPTYVERRSDAVHAHYAALGRAPVTYDYTVRLGASGSFRLPPTRVEALYSPEMQAMLPNPPLLVAPR